MAARSTGDRYDHHKGASPLLRRSSGWRVGVFLTVNLAGYIAANGFWRYLSTGHWVDFSAQAYYRDLLTPLGETILHPLSVLSYPWMLLVCGLDLAAILFVPVMVAVLYPLWVALAFVAIVAIAGHAPVLAIAIAVGCVVAARIPLRSETPFFAVVLGMVPIGIYLYFFSFGGTRTAQVLPLQRWVVTGPFFVAAVAIVLSATSALAMARLTRFRPGVVWPPLIVLVTASAVVFHVLVGVCELDYALITENLAPGDMVFAPMKMETWVHRQKAEGLTEQNLEKSVRDDLRRLQNGLSRRCERFLSRHGESHRAAGVLWIQAQCSSLQLDTPAFGMGTVRYSASFDSDASIELWKQLRQQWPGTGHAALAEWRLAVAALRGGDFQTGEDMLHSAKDGLVRFLSAGSAQRAEAVVFQKVAPVPTHSYYAEVLFRTRKLIWLLEQNDLPGDSASAEALTALLKENSREVGFSDRLGKLVSMYEKTSLGDNLKLAVAVATTDPYAQADMLIWLAEDERTDAAVEANYQLGMLAMQTARARALPLIPKLKSPESYFQTVIAAPPNPWQDLAYEHLSRLGVQLPARLVDFRKVGS